MINVTIRTSAASLIFSHMWRCGPCARAVLNRAWRLNQNVIGRNKSDFEKLVAYIDVHHSSAIAYHYLSYLDMKKNEPALLQWKLTKADTLRAYIFVRFREVSALERCPL